jgi:DNA-directed RNA polymerase specialized sigma24 family protein
VPGEIERIAEIDDPFELLHLATERLAAAQRDATELSRLRKRVIQDLHNQGMSYSQIADAAGLTRGRIHQVRHQGPVPKGLSSAVAWCASSRR